MYVNGEGVSKNRDTAAYYFILASLTADGKRPQQKEEALQRLADLGLDNDRLAKARALAEDWLRLNGG